MVDVVFVLLLFFMACSGVQERHVKAELPGRSLSGESAPAMRIEIASDGAVSINGQILAQADDEALTHFREWLDRRTAAEKAESPVMLCPANDASHGRFVQVLSMLNKAGLKKIAFA